MPRNGSGVYSKPAGTTAIADTTIESSKYNSTIDDLVADANAARPIVAGGTGASSAGAARTALAVPGLAGANTFTGIQKWAKGADVASATALTLGDDGNYFDITGTTTITSIATKGAGTVVKLHFDAGLTLTHHATGLILPGGANIVTAAGDHAEFVEYATGDWRCTNYTRASDNWVDVASATTTDIGAVASENIRITGTTTITGLGTVAAGTFRRARFAGILTLTHNGASLILPGSANITTAAGDVGDFISEGSGNWRCVGYTPAIKPQGIIQEVSSFTGAVATGTTTIPDDDTIPQNTEGTEFLSVSITPTRSDSILEIDAQFISSVNAATSRTVALFQSGVANALSAARPTTAGSGIVDGANIRHRMTSGTTSSTTFSVRAGPASGATITMNGSAGSRRLGGVMNSYITVREVLP